MEGKEEKPESETEKIKKNGLEEVYNYEAKEETKPKINGAIIVVGIIVVAGISLIVLRKLINKNSKNSKATK